VIDLLHPTHVLGRGDLASPVAGQLGQPDAAEEERHDQHGEDGRPERPPPRTGGRHLERPFVRTRGHAFQTGGALVRSDPEHLVDPDVRGTRLLAVAAGIAYLGIPGDLEGRRHRQHPEQGAVGTEVAAPEVGDEKRRHDERDQHPEGERRDVDEEEQHLHVGHLVVGRVEELLDRAGRHLHEHRPEEEGEKQVLDAAQGIVEPPGRLDLAPEHAATGGGQALGQRADRAEPGAKRLLQQ